MLEEYFISLNEAGFPEDWAMNIKPDLEKQAHTILNSLEKYPVENIYETISKFLVSTRLPTGLDI